MNSRPVKRVEDVCRLRAAQFSEDNGGWVGGQAGGWAGADWVLIGCLDDCTSVRFCVYAVTLRG